MNGPTDTCAHCGQCGLLVATDYSTEERVLLSPQPVPGGRVEVMRPPLTRLGLVAVDHITNPAPRQPAYELHSRTCPNQPQLVPVDLSEDPGLEQARGWRR